MSEELWLIWSNEHRAWWRANSCGYTQLAVDAGRYTMDEAVKICRAADYRSGSLMYGTGGPPETMVPVSFLGSLDRMQEYDNLKQAATRKLIGQRGTLLQTDHGKRYRLKREKT
jgi:hypothetical protein